MNELRFTIEEKEIVLRECEVKEQLELYDEIISLINFVEKISKNIMWNNSDLILKISKQKKLLLKKLKEEIK